MSHGPSSGQPEYLSSGDPAVPIEHQPSPGRRLAFLGGGVLALVGLVGGAMWAWSAYSSTGAQPSEALPADTLGYAAIDLDPSGRQKIEAIRTLRKFPAFTDEFDVETDDDLRRRIVEEAIAGSDCDLDYPDDIEPWLGQRFAVAAVRGDEEPSPVFVLQVTDADAADEGLATLRACGGGEDDGSWEIRDEWAVVAESDEIAEEVADAAGAGSLDDDEDFQRWTEAAGDPGIVTAYAAPEAGQVLLDNLGALGVPPVGGDPFSEDGMGGSVPPEAEEALADFGGAAVTVRFADGALEVEGATAGTKGTGYVSEAGADLVSTLPEDTAVAFGLGLEEGWGETLLDRVTDRLGSDGQDAVDFAETSLGLELPEDLETLLGESVALSLGSDVDAQTLTESDNGSDIPIGVKIRGKADEIEDILEKLRAAVGPGAPGAGQIFQADSEDDLVAFGPNQDYREQLLADGALGDSEAYGDVVREADVAGAVLFVNFDAGGWLDSLVQQEGDPEVAENVEPLEALGVSTWFEGDDGHLLLRLTTE